MKLASLHEAQLSLRSKALEAVAANTDLQKHLALIEVSMDIFDAFARAYETTDPDFLDIQRLGLRLFNDLGSAVTNLMAGYPQSATMQTRDALETAFLVDLLRTDRGKVARWRTLEDKVRRKEFSPVAVRVALDARDGITGKQRAEHYALLSGAAGHPNPASVNMIRPSGDDAVIGPFFSLNLFRGALEELARVALISAQVFQACFPNDKKDAVALKVEFRDLQGRWLEEFYGRPYDNTFVIEMRELLLNDE